jgi:hypothetical protein
VTDTIRLSSEFARISSLPRRSLDVAPSLVDAMTEALRTPSGTMRLRSIQALALHDAGTLGGGFFPIDVGGGKTLISLLAAWVLDAKRPLLLLPAGLIDKTKRERAELAKHWLIPNHVRLLSYEMLGRVQAADDLDRYQPDLFIGDEIQKLKNPDAAVTRRIDRYMTANPETRFVALSGTAIDRSLLEFGHILRWCIKGEACPIPRNDNEFTEWALALDAKVDELRRYAPGAFLQWSEWPDLPPLTQARRGFQKRLVETPGVVASSQEGERIGTSIYVRAITYSMAKTTEDLFTTIREEMQHPVDGWELEPIDVWRHARELALGYTNIWDPRPPDDWADARREWFAFVRRVLGRSKRLDSPEHVEMACRAGELSCAELDAWRAIEPTFMPNDVPVWHDDSALQVAAKWMKSHPHGIVWVEHVAFGERLEELTGFPYFREEARDATGLHIYDANGPIIASIDACREGLNLQTKWNQNLFTAPQEGPGVWQQAIARTHRPGQQADEVTVDVMLGCLEHAKAWRHALTGAFAVRDITGSEQKLLLADITWPSEGEIESWRGARWKAPATSTFRIPA